MTVRELEAAVKKMLAEAKSPSPDNVLSMVDLRTSLAEYLEELDEVFARSPERRNETYWTVWLMDVDDSADATFAVAVVRPDGVSLAAGHAEAELLKPFIAGGFAGAAANVIDAIAEHTTLAPTRIDAPRLTLNAWVNYEP